MKRQLILMGVLVVALFLIVHFMPHLSFSNNAFMSGALNVKK